MFVSSTRLCIHNIPATVDDAKLRKVVLKAVGDREARLTEVSIQILIELNLFLYKHKVAMKNLASGGMLLFVYYQLNL